MIGRINSINKNTEASEAYLAREQEGVKKDPAKPQEDKAVVVDISNKREEAVTYGRPKAKVDETELKRLIKEAEKSYQGLRDLVEKLIARQGKDWNQLLAGKDILLVDREARLEAEKLIGHDGDLGVEAVSDNLVNFAKAISGGDKSQFDKLKGAIEKGFREAERILGGQLPEISQRTYEATMKKLDEWYSSED